MQNHTVEVIDGWNTWFETTSGLKEKVGRCLPRSILSDSVSKDTGKYGFRPKDQHQSIILFKCLGIESYDVLYDDES